MGNEYYAPGEKRAAKVNALFATIARRYDLINDLQSLGLHRRWKRRVAELGAPRPGICALDLCCGTGDIAFALAARRASVIGVDFSEPMLEIARRRDPAARIGINGAAVRFQTGDALQLVFAAGEFDTVTIGYGLRNLANLETGLKEMLRVLKPGGRLVALEFGKPQNRLWRHTYFGYLKLAVPFFGLVFCRDASAYAYILQSLKLFPSQQIVAEKIREVGFGNVRTENFLGGAMAINYGEKPV
jgi:demethylmenaquinone methyltransferase/2-methoxy-6-polyprenyl-1,4-benzoquinol methylase